MYRAPIASTRSESRPGLGLSLCVIPEHASKIPAFLFHHDSLFHHEDAKAQRIAKVHIVASVANKIFLAILSVFAVNAGLYPNSDLAAKGSLNTRTRRGLMGAERRQNS